MNKFDDLDVTHHMLPLAPTSQVHETIAVSLALVTQLVINSVDIRFFKETLGSWGHLLACLSLY
jgi:hypothetical protein